MYIPFNCHEIEINQISWQHVWSFRKKPSENKKLKEFEIVFSKKLYIAHDKFFLISFSNAEIRLEKDWVNISQCLNYLSCRR